MSRRDGVFGGNFDLWPGNNRSPLAPLVRRYFPYLPLVAILGVIATLLEGIGIGLLIPLIALLLAQALPGGIPAPLADVAAMTAGLGRESAILALGGAVVAFVVVKGIVQSLNGMVIADIDGRLGRDIRKALCARMLSLDYPFFLRNEGAHLVQIISTDCWYASEAFRAVLSMIPAATALIVFGFILLWLDWRLTIIVVAGATCVQMILLMIQRRQRRLGAEFVASNDRLGERMLAVVAAIRSIRLFGQENRELSRFSAVSDEVRRGVFRLQRLTVSVIPMVEVLVSVLFVAVLLAGYRLGTALPTLTAYLVLLTRAQPYANAISRARVDYASLSGSVHEVEWLMRQQPAAASIAGSEPVAAIDRPIRFDNISYRYPDGTDALQDVSVTIRPGAATALIGRSGAGKSSFVDLLCRIAEPGAGAIFHGSEPLSELDAQAWRSRIAIAGQNVDLLDGSIAENIAYGRPDATGEEIEAAAEAAGAASFIARLPRGYATRLGLDGLKLSGGERQRIGVARALLRKPDLLILDEATSAVDAMSEQEIMSVLRHRRFRTALVISHRKSTVAACEEGIVLEHGRVLESGPLKSLDYFRTMATADDA